MRHIRFMLIVSAIALLGATAAQATVIYNWVSTSPGTYMTETGTYLTATGGELVITDAAYRSGSIDWGNFDANYDYETGRITNSPVVSASLIFDGGPSVFVDPSSQNFADFQLPFASSLTFNNDGTLSGYLFLYDSDDASQEVEAGGTNGDWNVFNYGSDFFMGAPQCGPPTCSGGSGYWSGPVRVPEPPVWLLFGLGVLGLLSLLRLRRKV